MEDTGWTADIHVRRADNRFMTDYGWLDSRHSFSFGDQPDRLPKAMLLD